MWHATQLAGYEGLHLQNELRGIKRDGRVVVVEDGLEESQAANRQEDLFVLAPGIADCLQLHAQGLEPEIHLPK